ncbi:MAG: crotonase/enoyl-CoA hydratase family protein [bacterium]|nr:crotonase/enoyl-CoA hydratase family protein [bacterium]MDE0668623.1 crotonase/enoyl-CoA hydratase family protein [bacterium]
MSRSAVNVRFHDSVALITLDDGKANVVTSDVIDGLWRALDAAEADASAVVLAGRPGVFSGGLDVSVLGAGGDPAMVLVHKATDVCLRLAEFPRPVVAACTGHAVALGAVFLLCSDLRFCAEGDFRIGFNEVSIGIPVPELVVGLARQRLSRRHLALALNTAQMYSPTEAVEVGFLDSARALNVTADALRAAADLGERLEPAAFAETRRTMTGRLGETIIRHAGSFMGLRDAPPPRVRASRNPVESELQVADGSRAGW